LHRIVRSLNSTVQRIPDSHIVGTFIGGRFLLSFFSTIATVAAPLYLVEISPPQYRATLAGLYNTLCKCAETSCGKQT
jgi:MFS family permease